MLTAHKCALVLLLAVNLVAGFDSDGSFVKGLEWDEQNNLMLSSNYEESFVSDIDTCADKCLETEGCVDFSTTNATAVIKVIYSSGTTAKASNTGTITDVHAGVKYGIKVEVLRNDLGSASERVNTIKLDGTTVGSCNPDGEDHDCTFYNCESALTETMHTPTSNTINVELVYTGHSHDCDCDTSSWQCSKENTVAGRTAMTAVARITLTPPSILCRTASAPDSDGNGITPQQASEAGWTLFSYALQNIWHPHTCSSVGSWCYTKSDTHHYYGISWDGKTCTALDLDSSHLDEQQHRNDGGGDERSPERASRYCRSPSSFAPGASYSIKKACKMSLCETNREVQVTNKASHYFNIDGTWYITNEVVYTIKVFKRVLCETGSSIGCRDMKNCEITKLQIHSVAGRICEVHPSGEHRCPSDLGTQSGDSIVVAAEHINAIAKNLIAQQVCAAT